MTLVLVRGIGDVGSAVALRLFQAGYDVIIQDTERPHHSRRGMAFTDAMFDRTAELEQILAKRARDLADLPPMVRCRRAIPVTGEAVPAVVEALRPDVLVDARMRKRLQPEPQRQLAPLTIGLRPNFSAPDITHLVVETAWGDRLGEVIFEGASLPLSGEPQEIAGHGRQRYVYAPVEGRFTTHLEIGGRVNQGDPVGAIGDRPVLAPLAGRLRGLSRDGVWVGKGVKIVEVDPRDSAAVMRGVGERPGRIAEGVLKAVAGALGPGRAKNK